jgi:hypothetical protein
MKISNPLRMTVSLGLFFATTEYQTYGSRTLDDGFVNAIRS